MKLEVGKKVLELQVKIGNIRKLDKLFEEEIKEMAGMRVGLGAFIATNLVGLGDIGALADVTRALSKEEVSQEYVEDFIYEYSEEKGIGELIDKVQNLLGKSPLLRDTYRRLEERAEKE